MKTFFLLFSLAFATVFLLNLGLPSVATTTGKKRNHSTPFGTESKSQGSWKADLSITLGILFVLVLLFNLKASRKPSGCLILNAIFHACKLQSKCYIFHETNQSFFLVYSLLFSIFWHSAASINNSKWSFIFYAKVKSWHARIERHFFPSTTLSVGNHEYA